MIPAANRPWKRVALLLFCVGWGANHFVALLLVYKQKLKLDAAAPAALLGIWMAPFVFAFPGIAFATLPALEGAALKPGSIGALAALTLAMGMLAQPLTRRRAPTTMARAGLVVGAAGTTLGAGALAWHVAPLLLVAASLLGAAYGVCMTSGLRTVQSLARPETLGGLTGLYYVLTYVGFGTPLALALLARSHLMAPLTSLLGVGALALVAAVALRAPSQPTPAPEAR